LDNVKCPNIRIIGVLEEEDKKKDHEKILEEIIVENFPKMRKQIITQVQETQRVPNRINPRQNTPRHILIKLTKIKHTEQILKAAREKQQTAHEGIPIRITADLSIQTLQARREWQDILKEVSEIVLISFNFFSFLLSVSFILTILSSTSLILSSASVILLLVPSRVF